MYLTVHNNSIGSAAIPRLRPGCRGTGVSDASSSKADFLYVGLPLSQQGGIPSLPPEMSRRQHWFREWPTGHQDSLSAKPQNILFIYFHCF